MCQPVADRHLYRRLSSPLTIPYLNRDDFKAPVYPLFAEFGVPVVAEGVFNFDARIHAFRSYIAERSERCFEIRLRADPDVQLQRFIASADPPLVDRLRPSVVAATRR